MSESATMIPLRQINRNMPARNSYPLDLSCELIKTTSGATDGFFVGEVPQLKACYSQGKTIDELSVSLVFACFAPFRGYSTVFHPGALVACH